MEKDGIYRIKLTVANPYNEYLVIKTYEGKQRARKLPTLEECKQQIAEWDEEYKRAKVKAQKEVKHRERAKATDVIEYVLKDKDDKIITRGSIQDVTQFVGCSAKTIYNTLCTEGRKISYCKNNKIKYLDVIKNVQTINDIVINSRICW